MNFQIVDPVGHAYKFLWTERRYIARLAALPLLVKFACQLAIGALGYDTAFIRQALVMLPSFFMDGWMLAHIVRFVLYGQRWPFRSRSGGDNGLGTGRDMEMLADRARGILSGTAAYMLIRFLMTGMVAFLYMAVPHGALPGQEQAVYPLNAEALSPAAFLASLLLLFLGLWAFRLIWLYIPAAANISLLALLRSLRGIAPSFGMLGIWLIGALPLLMALIALMSVLAQPLAFLSLPASATQTLLGACWSLADTLVGVVTTFAMAFALRPVLIEAYHHEQPVA